MSVRYGRGEARSTAMLRLCREAGPVIAQCIGRVYCDANQQCPNARTCPCATTKVRLASLITPRRLHIPPEMILQIRPTPLVYTDIRSFMPPFPPPTLNAPSGPSAPGPGALPPFPPPGIAGAPAPFSAPTGPRIPEGMPPGFASPGFGAPPPSGPSAPVGAPTGPSGNGYSPAPPQSQQEEVVVEVLPPKDGVLWPDTEFTPVRSGPVSSLPVAPTWGRDECS